MLSQSQNNTIVGHELTTARTMQTRRNRRTPGTRYSQRIDVLNSYSSGEKLKVCIARSLGGIGDVLMTTPVLRAIKIRFPHSEITYATDPQYANGGLIEILKNNPYIDHIVPFAQANRNQFHLYADLTSVGVARERMNYPPVNRIDLFADFVGVDLFDPTPIYVPTKEEQLWARTMINKWTGGKPMKVITVHISSVDNRRNWPVQNFIELVGRITSKYDDVFVIIFDQHKKGGWGIKNTQVANNYGIRQVAALIDASQLFIGPDSGLMHIAGALEKHMITLFGSTDPRARINHYINAKAIIDPGCQICWYNPCGRDCMGLISINEVWQSVQEVVSSEATLMSSLGSNIIVDNYQLFNMNSVFLQDAVSNTTQITATPVLVGPQKNYLASVNDIAVEMIDLEDIRKRKYPRCKSVGVVTSLISDISDEQLAILKGYKALLVGTPVAKALLKSYGLLNTYIWTPSISIDPKPQSIGSISNETCKFGLIIDKSSDDIDSNLQNIVSAFKASFPDDIEKRLVIYAGNIAYNWVSNYIKSVNDMRISVSKISGLADLSKFYRTIDCYIEADPLPAFVPWLQTALSKGIGVLCGGKDLSNVGEEVYITVKTEQVDNCFIYDIGDLTYYMQFYAENGTVVDEDSLLRISYVRLHNNKKDSAHSLLLLFKDL